jgi:serine protease Do
MYAREYPIRQSSAKADEAQISGRSGTAFYVSDRLVVSNYHVVRGAKSINVLVQGREVPAEVVTRDETNDLAIMKLSDSTGYFAGKLPYELDASDVSVGSQVFTFGFPLGDLLGHDSKYSEGVIASLSGIADDPRLMQITAPLQPGNSGGPLFTSGGHLVGVVVASLDAKFVIENYGVIPQNVNFAVKVGYLKEMLKMLPECRDVESQGVATTDKEALSRAVVQVRAS